MRDALPAYSANQSRSWSSKRPRRGRDRANARAPDLGDVGLGVELADPGVAERHQIEIVVLVRRQPVAADGLALRRGGDAAVLPLAGVEVEPEQRPWVSVSSIHTLPSTFIWVGVTMLVWVVMPCHSLWQRIGGDLLGLAVDLGGAGLVRHADPDIAVGIELEVERAFGLIRRAARQCIVRHLAGLGIELADELVAEIGIPGMAVGIDDHVMRQRFLARQIVFGDDHMGGLALRPRQPLQAESLLVADCSM